MEFSTQLIKFIYTVCYKINKKELNIVVIDF